MFNRINKIDNDMRRKILDKTKNGKVHRVKHTELSGELNKNSNNKGYEIKVERQYVTIECEKNGGLNIDAEKEIRNNEIIGFVLDKRR